jgi:nitrogen regulatory protein PII
MKQMKKVEVIIEAIYLNRLLDLFKDHDIHGYTIIRDIEGLGGHGLKTADDVCDLFSNIYIFTVCEEEQYQGMDKDIRNFLAKYNGKCILSDVMLLLGKSR